MDNSGVQPDPNLMSPPRATVDTQTPTTVVNVNPPAPSPWVATPVPTPSVETVATTTTVSETPAVEEPLTSKKKGASPVLLGLVALVLIGGVAGMTFMVSRGVSSQTPIAPNAPASEPRAFEPTVTPDQSAPFDPLGSIDCSSLPNTAPYGNRCYPTRVDSDGSVVWVNDPNPQ